MLPPKTIWIAESYSCQKDVICLLRSHYSEQQIKIIASHSAMRPELQHHADIFIQQPEVEKSAEWLLEQCINHQVALLFCGKHAHFIEPLRPEFEQHHIQLVTGAIGLEQHQIINDKYRFTMQCMSENLPAIPCLKVNNTAQLVHAIEKFRPIYPEICAKPVHGVYGAGFVHLRDDVNYFKKFQSSTVCNTQQFIEAYAQLEPAIDYIVLPFLTGLECSVDIACDRGVILAQVTRIKYDFFQECYTEHPCHEICQILVNLFQCDGLINIQFKQDQDLNWHILEINPRPAGGFAYTAHTDVNLISTLIAQKLNLPMNNSSKQKIDSLRPMTQVCPISSSMRVDECRS
ncbi:ATP-grasp domain-containing protein [Acinetobacter lanii]|uniref:ATP-grasp domain-containing protein n=1 Tax=Acinetobacter lanii TaxID=2715163 RepID=UPI001D0E93A6|nr:ATP-grasp domain-containing protein [Acinetobacter lanii]